MSEKGRAKITHLLNDDGLPRIFPRVLFHIEVGRITVVRKLPKDSDLLPFQLIQEAPFQVPKGKVVNYYTCAEL